MMTPSNQTGQSIEDSVPPQLSDHPSTAQTIKSPSSSLVAPDAATGHSSSTTALANKPTSLSVPPSEAGPEDSYVTLSSEPSQRVLKKTSSMSDNDVDSDLKYEQGPHGPTSLAAQGRNKPKDSNKVTPSSPHPENLSSVIERTDKADSSMKSSQADSSDQSMANSSRSSGYSSNSQMSDVSPPISVIPMPSAAMGKRGKSNKNHVRAPSSDSSISKSHSTKSKAASGLRRGKWTVEEEAYVSRVIQDFNSGFLNAPAGTTLRSYLSEKLHCDPMRITKKFTGDSCIGKRVFHPAIRCATNAAAIDKAQAELDALERRWRRRLEMQQRESAKKAAASAAAAAAVASGRAHPSLHANRADGKIPMHPLPASTAPQVKQGVVAQTASWLDRANAALAPTSAAVSLTNLSSAQGQDPSSLSHSEIEDQMRQVQQLIHEGPAIQHTTAGLNQGRVPIPSPSISPGGQAHADKRARTDSSASIEEEHDAEALVGFLQSVRASAASTSNP